jgi:hypothetical protein
LRILSLLLVASCTLHLPDLPDPSAPPVFDCEKVALADGLGDPDPCDVAACQACVDACGAECVVLDSYPPQYSCDGSQSFDVYDACPDWTFPEA